MIEKKMLEELQEYVNEGLDAMETAFEENMEVFASAEITNEGLKSYVQYKRKVPFAQVLFDFIDQKGYRDTEVYKKAGIDRRHFSKIRSNPGYQTGKNTVLSLAFALQLNRKEAEKLLKSAGFSLSDNHTFDLVIQFCLEKNIYDIDDVNQALDSFSLKPLGRL